MPRFDVPPGAASYQRVPSLNDAAADPDPSRLAAYLAAAERFVRGIQEAGEVAAKRDPTS